MFCLDPPSLVSPLWMNLWVLAEVETLGQPGVVGLRGSSPFPPVGVLGVSPQPGAIHPDTGRLSSRNALAPGTFPVPGFPPSPPVGLLGSSPSPLGCDDGTESAEAGPPTATMHSTPLPLP